MSEVVRELVLQLQEIILKEFPDTMFKLDQSTHDDIWHFSVFTPSGNIQMPPAVLTKMMDLWHEHKITVIASIYLLSVYQEQPE